MNDETHKGGISLADPHKFRHHMPRWVLAITGTWLVLIRSLPINTGELKKKDLEYVRMNQVIAGCEAMA